MSVQKHFVVFYSPGTFVSEVSEKEIDSCDIEQAKSTTKNVKERHVAVPYAFRFITKEMDESTFSVKEVAKSNMYYLGGKLLTLTDIPNTRENEILRCNMETNGWNTIIVNTNSYKVIQPFEDGDVLLE